MLYSVRSERLLMEEMDYNMLFRWFVGLNMDDEVWDATTFTKNRERLLEGDIAKEFLRKWWNKRGPGNLSDEHFTVDGTLLEAWAIAQEFSGAREKKDPPPPTPRQSHGQLSRRETHQSDARFDDGSGGDAGAQRARQGGEVELQRASADGESKWADGGRGWSRPTVRRSAMPHC